MVRYLIRRLVLMVPTLVGMTLVVFTIMAAAPGGITANALMHGMTLEPEARQAMTKYYNRLYGLDQPAPVQYLRWLNNLSPIGYQVDDDGRLGDFSWQKGSNLGMSFRYARPVLQLLQERLPVTLLLNLLSIPLIYAVSLAFGVQAAQQKGRRFDQLSNIVLLALWSVPTMLAGVLLIGFFASDQWWHWFPTGSLGQRKALDQTFLPWFSPVSAGMSILCAVVVSVALLSAMSMRMASQRYPLYLLWGAVLGAVMAPASPAVISESIGVAALLSIAPLSGRGPLWLRSTAVVSGLFIMCLILQVITQQLSVADGVLIFVMGTISGLCAALPLSLRVLLSGTSGVLLGVGVVQAFSVEPVAQTGYLFDRLWHLVLPVLTLSYGGLAFLTKLVRASVLENLSADYARTARAKGLDEETVLWRHVFRNSLLPLITVSATLLPSLLAGSVVVESIFSIDGMGKLVIDAVGARDRELVLSITLLSGVLTLLGYLLADLAYAIVDPRVRYE